jgi:hypothetical protein
MCVLMNSFFTENSSTLSWLTPSFYDWGVTFSFKKPGAYAQTIKSEDKSVVRLENKGSGAIAPNNKHCFSCSILHA